MIVVIIKKKKKGDRWEKYGCKLLDSWTSGAN